MLDPHGIREVRLRPAFPLTLQLDGEDAAKLAGVRMRVWTEAWSKRKGGSVSTAQKQVLGYAEGKFDAQGRIVIDAIATGRISLDPVVAEDAPFVPARVWGQVLSGGAHSVTLPVVKTRVVKGRVVDSSSGAGIAGVVVRGTSHGSVMYATTVDDGSFRVRVHGKSPSVGLWRYPDAFHMKTVEMSPFGRRVTATASAKFELQRGRSIRGKVVDNTGKAVPFAFVKAIWKAKPGRRVAGRRSWWRSAFASESGNFEIHGLARDALVTLIACGPSAISKAATLPGFGAEEIELRLEAAITALASGRITDARGNAIANAVVMIEAQSIPEGRAVGGAKQTLFKSTTSDDEGAWTSPVPLGADFRVRVEKAGFSDFGSPWFRRPPPAAIETRMRRLMTLSGRVMRGGKPVRAEILYPTRGIRTETAADGSFAFAAVPAQDALVVIRSDTRDYARLLKANATLDLAPRRRTSIFDDALRDRRLAVARKVLETRRKELEKSGKAASDLRFWQAFGRVDPGATVARVASRGFAQAFYGDATLRTTSFALAAANMDEAISVARSMESDFSRCLALTHLASGVRTERRLALGFDALWAARNVQDPARRLVSLSRAAEALYDAGAEDMAQRVFEEAEPLVDQLSTREWPGYARACWATDTAYVDLRRSLSIIDDLPKGDRPRHWANIAHELADKDPDAAQRVFQRLEAWSCDTNAARVAARMAKRDLARARALIERVGHGDLKAFALAAIADATKSKDLLEEAIASVRGPRGSIGPSVVLAGLLDFVARVSPDRIEHVIARAISLRAPRATDPQEAWRTALEDDCKLAILLAAYDVEAARAVFQEARSSVDYLLTDRRKYDPSTYLLALALLEPQRAMRSADRIPKDHPQPECSIRDQMRQIVVRSLAIHDRSSLRERAANVMYLPEMGEDQ